MTRLEQDSTGQVRVPKNVYYGAFTTRALENFQISGMGAPELFITALGLVKKASAMANMELKTIPQKHAKAIIKAADEFLNGEYDDQFTLDVYQAGAGTPFNMNANEIIANRANDLLGGKKGKYDPIHPNNQVNMGQSSNDVIPTATRIAALFSLDALLIEAQKLEKALNRKAKEFGKIKKVGRTHLQDAVPITLGREFAAYCAYVKRNIKRIEASAEELKELGIGGTAVGTGINAHPKFAKTVIKHLSKMCGVRFKEAANKFELISSHTAFLQMAGTLKSLATDLNKIANDLKLLNSGPKAGLGEILLPEVQPGSSIMPGKVNPSIPECVTMIYAQVVGNESAIEAACNEGHLELNTMCPVIMHNLLFSIGILTNGMNMFREKCIKDIKANKENIKKYYEESLCEATALVPKIGYEKTAKLVKEALRNGTKLKEL
ncbi:MAG: aspartate ammonia-lyase [Patescibacteria group bacterium]|nr:aspartate ammonia-lyase [Patescibacteria group bacterium]